MDLRNKIIYFFDNNQIDSIEFPINSFKIKISKDKISIYDIKKRKQSGLNMTLPHTKHICTYTPLCFGLEQINKSKIIFNKITYDDIVENIEKVIN